MARTTALLPLALLPPALLLSAGAAHGYVQAVTQTGGTPLHWIGVDCVRLRLDLSSTNHVIDGSDLGALSASAANWSDPIAACSYMRLVVEQAEALPTTPPKGKLRSDVAIFFIDQGWENLTGATVATVALTTLRYVDKPGDTKDGQILDADLDVNAESFQFSLGGVAGTLNVQQTLTHELGHVLGLDHPCAALPGLSDVPSLPSCSSGNFRQEVMYPTAALGDSLPHNPAPDEVGGICTIYPRAADPGKCASPSGGGGCAVAPPGGGRAVAGLAVLLALLVRQVAMRRRRGV